MDKKLTCCKCGQKASYREKGGELYCQKCHNNGKEVSYKTYTGNDSVTNTTYINCPHCGMGDTCGTDGCVVYSLGHCGIYYRSGSDRCPECKRIDGSKKKEEKNRKQADKYNKYLEELEKLNGQIDVNDIKVKEYRKIKDLKNKIEDLLKEEIENLSLRNYVETHLKKPLEELENRVPQQTLFKMKQIDNKGWEKTKNCRHLNIYWRDLFQKDEIENTYCLDCGEDENASFTKVFQQQYCKKVERWLDEKGLKRWKFTKFLKKKDYYDNWQDLQRGKFFGNIKDEFLVFQDMSKYIEELCHEFAGESGIIISNSNVKTHTHTHTHTEREREREQNQSQQSQLLSEISNLEQKPSKTPQQEQDLARKKQELEKLQKKEKELFASLPLENKISILEKEIKELEKKENKNKEEEKSLAEKKRELERLLEEKEKENNSSNESKNKSDKTALYIGLGIVGVVLVGLVVILVRKSKRKKKQ